MELGPKKMPSFKACLPFGLAGSPTIPIKVLYTGKDPAYPRQQKWLLENPLATLTVNVSLDSRMEDNRVREVNASVEFEWNHAVEFVPASTDQSDIRLIGFNVIDERRVSLLLMNNASVEKTVGKEGTHWFYRLISDTYTGSPACGHKDPNKNSSRECLIFSFLVMDPDQFANEHDNDILANLRERFSHEALKMVPQHLPEAIFRAGEL